MADPRRKVLIGLLLLLGGIGAGMLFARPIVRTLDRFLPVTEERIRLDAVSLLDLVRPDPRLPEDLSGATEFWKAWDERRARYSAEQLADLRRRLDDYLDFVLAEHADAAEIYRAGYGDKPLSDAAREARERVRRGFGEAADGLFAEMDTLREQAYLASPKVARGVDPDITDFAALYDDVLTWMPRAQARVAELTKPVAPR